MTERKRRNYGKAAVGYLVIGFMVLLSIVNLVAGADKCRDNNAWYWTSLVNLIMTTYLFTNHAGGYRTVSSKAEHNIFWDYFMYIVIIVTAGVPFSIARFECESDAPISFWQWGLVVEMAIAVLSLLIEMKGRGS
jgi:hypothetical protein